MKFEKSTKGSHKFLEVDENDKPVQITDEKTVIGNLYIRKTAMPNAPEHLNIVITEE